MEYLNLFEKENIIYQTHPNFCVLEYDDIHGFTPEILKDKKNIAGVYQSSSIKDKKEIIIEYIGRVQGLYYIYLTLDFNISEESKDNYKMRIYYDYKDRQQINLLLTSLKK